MATVFLAETIGHRYVAARWAKEDLELQPHVAEALRRLATQESGSSR